MGFTNCNRMKLKLASRKDALKISQLRKDAYRKATGSILLNDNFLNWNDDDDRSSVVYVEDLAGEAISCMRAMKVNSTEEIESLFDIKIHSRLYHPILTLDKATTLSGFRRQGLTGILRHHFLEAAIIDDVQHIVFTVNDNVSRIPFLKELGFTFESADITHRLGGVFNNSCKVLFGVLNRQQFQTALEISREKFHLQMDMLRSNDLTKKELLIATAANWQPRALAM